MKNKNKKTKRINRHASAIYRKGNRLFIKKSLIILTALITAVVIIGFNSTRLLNDLQAIESVNVPKDTKQTEKPVKTNPVAKKHIPVVKTASENEKEVLEAVKQACKHHGMDNQNCINDLMGIAYAEHRDFSKSVGDGGKSIGVFQIHTGYHREITADQANDTFWAAKWTLRRMIYNGYKNNRDYAIMKHNGTPNTAKTLEYLKTVKSYK